MSKYYGLPKSVSALKVGDCVASMQYYGCSLSPIKDDEDFPYHMDILFDKIQDTPSYRRAQDPHRVVAELMLKARVSDGFMFNRPKSLDVIGHINGVVVIAAYQYDGHEFGLCLLSDKSLHPEIYEN